MFSRRRARQAGGGKITTVLGRETSLEGTLQSGEGLRIDGRFKGTIVAEGDVVIGESAYVEATLRGRNVVIAGEVHGEVEAAGRIELAATGKLYGDLKAVRLLVEEGAVFQGNCYTAAAPEVVAPGTKNEGTSRERQSINPPEEGKNS